MCCVAEYRMERENGIVRFKGEPRERTMVNPYSLLNIIAAPAIWDTHTKSPALTPAGYGMWYNNHRKGAAGRRLVPKFWLRSNRIIWNWGGYFFLLSKMRSIKYEYDYQYHEIFHTIAPFQGQDLTVYRWYGSAALFEVKSFS